jgi:Outer membrane protein beta-barrel domain
MKNEKKNIDQLIGEKLKGYEHIPPKDVWNGIAQGLSTKSEKSFLLPFWKIAAGIAILIGVGLSYLMINRSDNLIENNSLVENNYSEPVSKESKNSEIISKETTIVDQNKTPENKMSASTKSFAYQNETVKTTGNSKFTGFVSKNNSESIPKDPDLVVKYPNLSADDLPYQKEFNYPDDKIILPVKTKIIASWDMLQENTLAEEVQISDKYSLSASMSPLYSFRDIRGSHAEDFNNAESGKISYSGGLQFGIRQNKKLSFQTGVFYSRLGIGVDNIYAFNGIRGYSEATSSNNTYIAANSIGQINASTKREVVFSSNKAEYDMGSLATGLQTESPTSTDAQLNQYFHVLEVPFLARYNIIDRSVNVNILGGLSTNFIIGNEVYINEGDSESYFGKTSSINTVNYSGNVGLGFDYEMNKNFLLSIEPVFKYYLNSINTENLIDASPYNFGFYTGIRYIF